MTRTQLTATILLLLMSILALEALGADGPMHMTSNQARAVRSAADLHGTWSGAFQSRHPEVSPFTVTVTIDQDDQGHTVGKLSHSSECLQEVDLQVTLDASKVSLAGSDQKGNSITFQGKIDKSGSLLSLHYIINGSAGGKCESDDGSGTIEKQ